MVRPKRLPLEQLQPYLLAVPSAPAPLDLAALFGNTNPVELEVGFGKGLFLLTASARQPDTNFLGVEIDRQHVMYVAQRLARRERRNVRVLRADARTFVPTFLPAQSLQAVHVFFPDPWWKRRHLKRRLFTAEFVGQIERLLRPGGQLNVISDVQDYFTSMQKLLAERAGLELQPPPAAKTPEHDADCLTNFERKYRQEGRPIYRASYLRRETVGGPRETATACAAAAFPGTLP